MILNQEDAKAVARYENFVRSNPYGVYTQDTAWAKVKNNWIPEYVYLEDEQGDIRAALSMIMIEAVPGQMFIYAPRGPVCDFHDIDTVEALLAAALPIAQKYNAFLLRMDPLLEEDEELLSLYRERGYVFRSTEQNIHSFIQPRYNMMMDFGGKDFSLEDEEPLFNLFNKRQRSDIRRSVRKGCEVIYYTGAEVERAEVEIFYELIKVMAKRQGIKHRPADYFYRLLKAYPEARLYLVKHEEDYLCGSIVIPYGEYVTYLYAASSNVKRNYNSSELMIYEEMKWCCALNKRYFDMGGVFATDDSDGLFLYKKRFTGAEGLRKFIGELDVVYNDAAYQEYLQK